MAHRFFLAVLLLVLIFSALIAGYPFYIPTAVEATNLRREVSTQWMFGRQPITVTTGINLAAYADCQQEQALLDVIMLIDASGSMEGGALDDAVRAAGEFINALDLGRSDRYQISLAFFHHELIRPVVPLTDNINRLQERLTDIQPDGGTNFVPPLIYAQSELESIRRRFGSIPIILFFSDGRPGDSVQALEIAEQIKRGGGQIFIVGLEPGRGYEPLDPDYLANLASDPSMLRITPSSSELSRLFNEIVEIVDSYVLQNVSYTELIALDQVTLVPGSLPEGVSPIGNGLRFSTDTMTREEATAFRGFNYQVEPNRLGLVDFTAAPAVLALEACGGPMQRTDIPPGPTLLVLPILPLSLAIPFGLLLLAALPFFFRPKPQITSTPLPPPPPPTPPTPPKDAFGAWLANAEDLDASAGLWERSLTNTPTLLVGLGSSGRVVLQQVAERVDERTGGNWPNNLKMLQISLPELESLTGNPLPTQVHEVEFKRSIAKLSMSEEYMSWARENSSEIRTQGRMSLFTDLSNGKTESALWKSLNTVLTGQRNITVWLITDGFGPASGMIADIAHLLRVLTGSNIIESVRLCLAMHNADWPSRPPAHIAEAQSYATVRELQRLQLRQETQFTYTNIRNQPELRSSHQGKMLDEIYLFDGIAQATNADPYDISRLPAEKGVLRAISNALLALLEPSLSKSFYENEKNAQSQISRSGEVDPENYGSVMGCAILRAPIEPTRRIAELRLIHQALFDPQEGLWGWGILTETGESRPATAVNSSFREEEIHSFINDIGTPSNLKIRGKELQDHLIGYLHEQMNEDDRIGLRWADGFLQALLERGYPDTAVRPFHNQVKQWIALIGPSSQSGAPSAVNRRRAQRAGNKLAPLVHAWEQTWTDTRTKFPQSTEMEPEQFAWTLEDEPQIYRQYLSASNMARRLRKRTFWHWNSHTDLELRLVILPPNLSDPDGSMTVRERLRGNLHQYTYGIRAHDLVDRESSPRSGQNIEPVQEDAQALLNQLWLAARPFSREILQETLRLDRTLNRDETQETLNRNASPLFKPVQIGGEKIATVNRRILMPPAGSSVYLPAISRDTEVKNEDPTTCIVFHAQHVVRFGNMQAYADAREQYNPDPSLFVFPPEQQAAKREQAARRKTRRARLIFSPQATILMTQDKDIADALGRLLVNGNLRLEPVGDKWYVQTSSQELAFLRDSLAEDLMAKVMASAQTSADRDLLLALARGRHPTSDDLSRMEEQVVRLATAEKAAIRDLAILIAEALTRF